MGATEQYTGCADSWTLELLPRAHEGVLSVARFAGQEKVWVQDKVPREGDLALFCIACPQPGINLPQGWEENIDP